MNPNDPQYLNFALVREMLETPAVIRNFNFAQAPAAADSIRHTGNAFFTGEGSSRIFPAKHFIARALASGAALTLATEGARQAAEYDLSRFTVIGASNSGKTKELVTLFRDLKAAGHARLFSVCAGAASPLGALAAEDSVLACGPEQAVAATKSVVEQALFLHALLDRVSGENQLASQAATLAGAFQQALTAEVAPQIAQRLATADVIHWAGRNDGVAEELALKTNEITRKRSAYLEGTYAVHGIEEVMTANDAVIVINPFESEEEKFEEVLVKGVGCAVIAIAPRPTRFPTLLIPALAGLDAYVQIAAGWNLLVEIAQARGINMDKPERARKVGNEVAS